MTSCTSSKEKVGLPALEWLLESNDKNPIATFVPAVLAMVSVVTPNGGLVRKDVRLCLRFADGRSREVVIPVSKLQGVDWFDVDCRCILNAEYRGAREGVLQFIRAGISGAPEEVVYHLEHTGIHRIGDEVIFAAGDRVLTRSSGMDSAPVFELAESSFHLDIDPECAPGEAFAGIMELISLSPKVGRALVAHVISGLTRAAFVEAGFVPCAVLTVVGESGMLKSHYVPQLAQVYNRADEVRADTRFNSTSRFIEDVLYEHCECTAVIDDLHTAESKGIKKQNESTAEEIIRRISDDTGRGRMSGNSMVQRKFRGNAVFIGEYVIGKASTIPRSLIVRLTQRPDGRVLDKYQRHQQLDVSTFYYHFLQWYVDNFEAVRDEINDDLTRFRQNNPMSEVHGRLNDTKFYLLTAYKFFLKFSVDSGFCSEQDAFEEHKEFADELSELTRAQQEWFRKDTEQAEKVNFLKLIRKLYRNNGFRLASSAEQFDPTEHDGLIYYECLCLRGNCLEKKIRKIVSGVKINNIIAELLDQKVLKLVKKKHTVQINECGGLRFYAIHLNALEKQH